MARDFLFDMDDVAYLARCTMEGLKREKWRAELELHSAEFWFDDESAEFWEEYLDAVTCAIATKLKQEKPIETEKRYTGISAADVKERLDIINVIEGYTDLKKSGTRMKGRCPLHQDRNPSLTVYPDQQSWHCFSCNQGGDVFEFIQLIDKVSFPEAVNILSRY